MEIVAAVEIEQTTLVVRLDLSGENAAVGLKEAFDLDLGAQSDRSVILFDGVMVTPSVTMTTLSETTQLPKS
jgi:hypothetical protein